MHSNHQNYCPTFTGSDELAWSFLSKTILYRSPFATFWAYEKSNSCSRIFPDIR